MAKILSAFVLMLLPILALSQEGKPNASILIEEIIDEHGIEKAQKKFQEIQSDTSQFILIESEFNTLGYSYVRQRKFEEAIAVLKMNIQTFPGSWNVYDSLGEGYMRNGQYELAIEFYNKSLEINPENTNGLQMLKTIEQIKNDK